MQGKHFITTVVFLVAVESRHRYSDGTCSFIERQVHNEREKRRGGNGNFLTRYLWLARPGCTWSFTKSCPVERDRRHGNVVVIVYRDGYKPRVIHINIVVECSTGGFDITLTIQMANSPGFRFFILVSIILSKPSRECAGSPRDTFSQAFFDLIWTLLEAIECPEWLSRDLGTFLMTFLELVIVII